MNKTCRTCIFSDVCPDLIVNKTPTHYDCYHDADEWINKEFKKGLLSKYNYGFILTLMIL